jgi:xanthine dehydrogenase accessory factor
MARDQCCGGEVQVYIRVQRARPEVVLVGAGHVAHAIARALGGLPFSVTVIDDRMEWNTAERFPSARRIVDDPEDILLDLPLSPERTYMLILSHSHKRDFEVLRLLVPRRLHYLGLIGSASKWGRFRRALLAQGFLPADVERVRSPIGIGVGGKTAEEIAISVVAELLAVRDGRTVRVEVPGMSAIRADAR